jgi:rSAM/selenodomain-associated transferase 1
MVKTRLVPRLGAQATCSLYRAFILDLQVRLRTVGYPQLWFHWPDDPRFVELVPAAAAVALQRGADLGERMEHAFDDAFAARFSPVIMIGADVPHVPLAHVRTAAARLVAGADVALGPADDGGYYLLGLRQTVPDVFRNVTWGTEGVAAATAERVVAAGLRLALLPRCYDIDEIADVERLARAIASGAATRLDHTRDVLGAIGLPCG